MVSFYRLKYTSFISTDNYLVGDPHEISPESRFLALGARKGHVIADLNYSCFLARRASLFLFGSLVRRSHPAVSFGYRFHDYEDLFSEFSALSLSYVRDWVPGLLTNYKVLFRTALKEEGALRRIGFFFQFPDILMMFGANDSMGFIVNEARAIKIPTIVTGDTSISFSRITYMLLSNYKSFKSTVFFVKLFLDLNAESLRFRTLRHYSIFKRFIKSIFLRRTLKSKLFSIKLARMFFIFKAFPKLRVSQINPVVYKSGSWRSSSFFKVPGGSERARGMTTARLRKGNIGQLIPIRGKEYVANRPTLPESPSVIAKKLRRSRLVVGMKLESLPKWKASSTRPEKAKVSRQYARRMRLLRRRRANRLFRASLVIKRPNKLSKLLTVAKRRGLRVEALLKKAKILSSRLRRLNRPNRHSSDTLLLPNFMVDRSIFRQVFPLLGYFAHGYMAKRLNTLFFYRAIFRQIIQKRKKILRLKRFTNKLGVISAQAKRFRALNLAVNRRRFSILKLRARVKKFGKKFRTVSRLGKLRKISGFNEQLYVKKLLDRNKANKQVSDRFNKNGNRGWLNKGKDGKYHKNDKFGNKGNDRYSKDKPFRKNTPPRSKRSPEQSPTREVFVELLGSLGKKQEEEVKDPVLKNKPKWLKDLDKINRGSYEKALKKNVELKPRKRKITETSSGKRPELAFPTLTGNHRAMLVRNFTPTQRHVLRVYRILSTKYPSFMRKSEAKIASERKTVLFPRTLRQYLVKTRKLRSEAFFRRTGKVHKFRKTIGSLLPKPFKRGGFKHGKGNKPWHKNRGKGFSGFNRDTKKPYDPNYRNRNWSKGDNAPYDPNHNKKDWRDRGGHKDGGYSRRSSYNPDYKNRNWGNKDGSRGNTSYNPDYKRKGWKDKGGSKDSNVSYNLDYKGVRFKDGNVSSNSGYTRKDWSKGNNVPYNPDYKNRSWDNKVKGKDSYYSKKPYDPNYRGKYNKDINTGSYDPDYRKDWKDRHTGSKDSNVPYKLEYGKKDRNYPKKPYDPNYRGKGWDNRGKGRDGNAVGPAQNKRVWEDKGGNYSKGKGKENVQDTRPDKGVSNQIGYRNRKSKKSHDKTEEEANVTNSEFPDTVKKSIVVDKGSRPAGSE